MAARPGDRYSSVSILLHWTIAAAIGVQIWLGSRFVDLPRGTPEKTQFFDLHLSLGVTILALSLARLVWRLFNPAPPLPRHFSGWERILARATHVGFYLFMIGMPLTGWLTTSTGRGTRPLELWGAIPWFRVQGVPKDLHGLFETLHVDVFLKGFWVLLALHVAGALWHHFLVKDEVLWRMLPLVKPKQRGLRP